jgi:hydrogenase nickel incorporation protein HypA/HybF
MLLGQRPLGFHRVANMDFSPRRIRDPVAMHELSIAQSLIEMASEAAAEDGCQRVTRLFLRLGAMSGVVREALEFSFQLAAEDTPCAGATLEIEETKIIVYCPSCEARKTISDGYILCCPTCGQPTPQILSGRELELISIEVDDYAAANR